MKKIILFAAAICLAACNSNKVPTLTGISLNKTSLEIEMGESKQLVVIYEPAEAESGAPEITWESSNPRVATVNNNGKVTGLQKGRSTITAFCGKLYAECKVDVATGTSVIEREEEDELSVTPTTINAPSTGGEYTIKVNSNIDWAVSCEEPWATVSPTSGSGKGSVTVTVEANTAEEPTTQQIAFTAGTLSKSVTLNRAGEKIASPLSINITEKEIPLNGGSFDVTVTTNIEWEAKCDNSRVHFSGKNENAVTITVDLNPQAKGHYASIDEIPVIFTNGESSATLTIKQECPYIKITPNEYWHMSKQAVTFNTQVESNIPWQVKFVYDNESSGPGFSNWASSNKTSGTGNATIAISFSEIKEETVTTRSGYLYVVGTGSWEWGGESWDKSNRCLGVCNIFQENK